MWGPPPRLFRIHADVSPRPVEALVRQSLVLPKKSDGLSGDGLYGRFGSCLMPNIRRSPHAANDGPCHSVQNDYQDSVARYDHCVEQKKPRAPGPPLCSPQGCRTPCLDQRKKVWQAENCRERYGRPCPIDDDLSRQIPGVGCILIGRECESAPQCKNQRQIDYIREQQPSKCDAL